MTFNYLQWNSKWLKTTHKIQLQKIKLKANLKLDQSNVIAAGRDWGQEEKGMTEDEMVGWHHRLHGREFE